MNDRQIIRAILKRMGMTQPELSEKIGYKKETVGTILKGKSEMGVGKLYRMLNALGYEVIIRRADGSDPKEFRLEDNEDAIPIERYSPEVERLKAENVASIKTVK